MRTPEQIQRQVSGLLAMKSWLPQFSLFGDNNWRVIDEQVQIIKGESTFEEIEDAYIKEGFESAPFNLYDAEAWLNEEVDEDVFIDEE